METEAHVIFPMQRDLRCPFDPPPGHRDIKPIERGEIWDGSNPWLIADNALYRQLITDPRVSNDVRRDGYPSMTAAFKELRTKGGLNTFDRRDGAEHEVTRRLLTKDFSLKHMEAKRPTIQQYLDDLFDQFLAGPQPADLVSSLAFPFTSRVICDLLGVPFEDYGYFVSIVSRLVSTASTPEVAMQAHVAIREYVDKLIDSTLASPNDGTVSRLVTEQLQTGGMNRAQITDISILLLVGGYETSANSMSLGTLALLSHPEQFADLRDHADDDALVANTVEELVRYISITHNGRRRVAKEDIDVEGITIHAGEGLIFLDDMCNRDPKAIPGDPDTVDIRRDTKRHVGFALGPHTCLGNRLARLELQIFFQTLVRRIPQLRLAVPFEDIVFRPRAQIYGIEALPVAWPTEES